MDQRTKYNKEDAICTMKTIIVTTKPTGAINEIIPSDIKDIIDGSIDQITLGMTLDHVENRNNLLSDVIQKLRYGGTLELTGVDIYDVARGLYICDLTLDDANDILYNGRQSCDTLQNIVHTLEELQLQINLKRIHKYVYYIKATRNRP